jgi:hypothetical protein
VHALLGLTDFDDVVGHPVVGGSWEGWVIENVLAVAPTATQAFFYRSSAGAEMDLVLELPVAESSTRRVASLPLTALPPARRTPSWRPRFRG